MNKDKEKPIKILSQYHQYFGVKKAYESIKKSLKPEGTGKAGIVWHTQGSGKSFSMVMLAHKLITDIEMRNPTVVILTDRNDLDNQLYTTFSNASEFLRTRPVQVESREDLLEKIGATKDEMIACGDGFNDLSMIKYAGLGVAMANAQEVVRESADYITLSNEEDGVAAVVEKFMFNQ